MENNNTVGTYFKSLLIIHLALCAGIAIILIVFRFLLKDSNSDTQSDNKILEIFGIAIGFIGVLASRFIFFFKTKSALSVGTLKEKLDIFRSVFITQMAILEGAAITNAVLYFITQNDLHFFIALRILLLMAFRRPTRAIAAMVLFNTMEDRQKIYDDSIEI